MYDVLSNLQPIRRFIILHYFHRYEPREGCDGVPVNSKSLFTLLHFLHRYQIYCQALIITLIIIIRMERKASQNVNINAFESIYPFVSLIKLIPKLEFCDNVLS